MNASPAQTIRTTCCIVGAGPAGVILSHLLARYGIDTILLEAEEDFDRKFRGDTVHPSTMEILEQLDLVEELLSYPHTKVDHLELNGKPVVDFSHISSKHPYITLIHQKDFLTCITKQSRKYKNFRLLMNTSAQKLIKKRDKVVGVECLKEGEWISIHADLIVGCDGRFSKMRKEGGFKSQSTTAPMDVLWFRLPKKTKGKKLNTGARLGKGHLLVMLEREDHWQLGFIIEKGSYSELREEGFEPFKKDLLMLAPSLKDYVHSLKNWKEVSLLNVESTMVKTWHQEGLVLIGDAAHIISPVGGVGINLAVKDAVTAANILAKPLKEKNLKRKHLAKVQKKRKWPTRIIQGFQGFAQKHILSPTLNFEKPPLFIRTLAQFSFVRKRIARMIGLGLQRVTIADHLLKKDHP